MSNARLRGLREVRHMCISTALQVANLGLGGDQVCILMMAINAAPLWMVHEWWASGGLGVLEWYGQLHLVTLLTCAVKGALRSR